ncbi:protein of unknown function [Formivibrio citricus]|uniref:YfiR family protein n=1 Tax=Formivibrio citricus TaxID=83765 RepID=A0A1I5AQW4_9NEIS|nr:YfiR family protein [Formivibrio citricus]SFN64823.1 protein of unknown function [Formivibrio citricus]
MVSFRSSLSRKACAIALLALYLAGAPATASAQPRASEPALKAAIIVNMLMFVDWPQYPGLISNQLRICYLDSSPVAEALNEANGKSIRNKTVQVQKKSIDTLRSCNAIYLSSADQPLLPEVLALVRDQPVLLVSDSPAYLQQGTMLNLDVAAGRIVFDFDLRAARQAKLQVSSKALRLARRIIE